MHLKRWLPVPLLCAVCLAATVPDPARTIELLQQKKSVLDSLTAQLQHFFLTGDEKLRETKERLEDSPFVCQGRLTTESGVPVSTSFTTQANQTSIYFTPYLGSRVALYTGTVWTINTFTQRTLALSGLTANRNYDVFIYNNAGTLTLELSAAWNADNKTRTDALTKQDGVYVKSGATTRRYLGTIRVTSATQTQDTATQRFVWNYYNRVRRPLRLTYATDSWTYGVTNTWRSLDQSTANRLEYVVGENEVPINVRQMVLVEGTQAVVNIGVGFGLDTVTFALTLSPRGTSTNTMIRQQMWNEVFETNLGLGYRFLQAVESGDNTTIFYGDAGDTRVQGGALGWIDG